MTPTELIDALDRILPGFRDYVKSDENYAPQDTLHGVFMACTWFVGVRSFDDRTWRRLADLVNPMVDESDDDLSNAVCTCFVEDIAERGHPLKPLLTGFALTYWEFWESK